MRSPAVPHRRAARALIALGSVLTVLAIFAVWAERQLLDTDRWVETSSELLQDEQIQSALSQYLVDQLYSAVDVQAELSKRLPRQAKPLAGPAAAGLRELASRAADRALGSSAVQTAWEASNRAAHQLLLDVIKGDGEVVQQEGGAVTLHLDALVQQLATRLGISADVTSKIPPDVADLEVLQSDQLGLAQDLVNRLHRLAIVLSVLALGALALAIYLAQGRRQVTVLWCGVGLIAAGLAVYTIRHVAGNVVIDAVVKTEAARPAAEDAWAIATSLMMSIATTVIVFGGLFVLASWLASPSPSGRATRRALAPALREHPVALYGLLAFVALIYLALAPTHGLRAIVTTAILAAFAAFGLRALRHQATEEFPDAQPGDTVARMRAWIGERARRPTGPAPAATAEEARLNRLERLARLREQGALTDDEFAAEKARALGAP